MDKILITGANGFIGRSLCRRLSSTCELTGLYRSNQMPDIFNSDLKIKWVRGDVTCKEDLAQICKKIQPDCVIHCAGLAHQSAGKAQEKMEYDQVNHLATFNLARAAGDVNSNIRFIYLSSVSVYGEEHSEVPIQENNPCCPTSVYGQSKLDAETSLMRLYRTGQIKHLDILRLAPVYDRNWFLNLEKRVLSPGKLCYLKYGTGQQKMSILSRANLSDFIKFRIENKRGGDVFNLCDPEPTSFIQIIDTLKRDSVVKSKGTIPIPLAIVWSAARVLGLMLPARSKWFYACYRKLAGNLIFDSKKMSSIGFEPVHNLKSVFK